MEQILIDDDVRLEHGVPLGTLWIGQRWDAEDLREREFESRREYSLGRRAMVEETQEDWDREEGAWLDSQR